MRFGGLIGILLALSIATVAQAEPNKGISFQAVLRDPEGRQPTASGLTAVVQILDPINNCVLREEEHSGVNISNGYLNLVVGSSSASMPLSTNPSPLLSIKEVMDNSKAINGFNCTYTPSSHHGRKLRLFIKVPRSTDGGVDDVIADFNMRAVAYAVNSETLNGKSDSQFINVNDSQNLTQTNVESIFQRFTKLDALLNNANSAGTSLGVNITGNAATATSVSGTVGIANGGTGAITASAARTNLGLGTLATLSPTGTADNTTYLRGDGTWATVSGGGGGTITQVTAGTGLSGGGSSGAVSVSVNYGTTAGTAAEGNDSRIAGAFQSSTNLTGGDLSGTLPGPTVSRINGVNVSTAVAGDDQKFLKFINGSGWQPHFIKLSELKNNLGTASVFNVAACTSSQTMAWSSLTDQFSCQDISLPVAKVTGLAASATTDATNATNITSGTLDAARLPSSVTNGLWTESGGNIYRSTGNVGIGTTNPGLGLDIRGTQMAADGLFDLAKATYSTSGKGVAVGYITNSGGTDAAAGSVRSSGSIPLRVGTSAYSSALTILDSNGFVGINRTNPVAMLNVEKTVDPYVGLGDPVNYQMYMQNLGSGNGAGVGIAFSVSSASNDVGAAIIHKRSNSNSMGGLEFLTKQNSTDAGLPSVVMSLTDAGNVGIGTAAPTVALDVNGAVRAGSSATVSTCGSGQANGEGSQRYNYTTHNMEYCNGTTWVALNSGSSAPVIQQQVFLNSGTFTTPSGTVASTVFKFTIVGGGGGGGPGNSAAGAGGGAGGSAIYYASGLAASTGYAVVVGNGGASGAAGGLSSVTIGGVTVTANGGGAGGGGGAGTAIGGVGGTATNGTINVVGGDGGSGSYWSYSAGGTGGASTLGGGGAGGQPNASTDGISGKAYGSGGGGAYYGSTTGGAGAKGIVIVEWVL